MAVCVRDDSQWKNCSAGHETADWVRQIEEAYRTKNGASTSEAQAQESYPATRIFKRQQTYTAAGMPTANPAAPNNPGTGQGAPLSVFTFIIAIALFVLVVAFVLLRIFVRNRRLRRMGIYPEGPIDRLLGGNFREFEDNLPPPRLWEAKITEVGAGGLASEKSGLEIESSETKRHGWDALMPVSAALPPNLYPIIYQSNEKSSHSFEPPSTYPPPPANHHTARINRHMPQFLRRQTGDGPETVPGAASLALPSAATATDLASALGGGNGEKGEEKVAASVNITVLIAMPSSRTIFPTNRRLHPSTSTTTLMNQRSATNVGAVAKLQEANANGDIDQDALSLKGKARRAPSLRSVRSTASMKSLGETRREAFFSQITKDEAGKGIPTSPVAAAPAPAYEEEEEELPELMFGTASVPIFARPGSAAQTATVRRGSLTPASRLLQPSKADILALVSAANRAREKKVEVEAAAGVKAKKQDEGDVEANRASVAETSLDGEGRSATAGVHDRSEDDALQTPLGDVTTRMFQSHNLGENQDIEMSSMGASRSYYSTQNSGLQTPTTPMPLLSMASPFDTGARTPTSSVAPRSGSSWHTGEDEADHRT